MYEVRTLCCYISYIQVNVGCVPKKLMFNAGVHAEYIRDHADYGFHVELKSFDWG